MYILWTSLNTDQCDMLTRLLDISTIMYPSLICGQTREAADKANVAMVLAIQEPLMVYLIPSTYLTANMLVTHMYAIEI